MFPRIDLSYYYLEGTYYFGTKSQQGLFCNYFYQSTLLFKYYIINFKYYTMNLKYPFLFLSPFIFSLLYSLYSLFLLFFNFYCFSFLFSLYLFLTYSHCSSLSTLNSSFPSNFFLSIRLCYIHGHSFIFHIHFIFSSVNIWYRLIDSHVYFYFH
jgi:hypothetical protein